MPIIERAKDLSHDLSQHERMYAEKAFECEAPRDLIEKKLQAPWGNENPQSA